MSYQKGKYNHRCIEALWDDLRSVDIEPLLYYEFSMDTACVEQKFIDFIMITINTIAVENYVAYNMYQRSELDYLLYNKFEDAPWDSGSSMISFLRLK